MLVNISMKFHECILNGFQVLERIRFCDGQTDSRTERRADANGKIMKVEDITHTELQFHKINAIISIFRSSEQNGFHINSRKVLPLNLFTLQKHVYSNILKISSPKSESLQIKILIFFHISAQKIDCGYSLEQPRRGGSNEYPQSMF